MKDGGIQQEYRTSLPRCPDNAHLKTKTQLQTAKNAVTQGKRVEHTLLKAKEGNMLLENHVVLSHPRPGRYVHQENPEHFTSALQLGGSCPKGCEGQGPIGVEAPGPEACVAGRAVLGWPSSWWGQG